MMYETPRCPTLTGFLICLYGASTDNLAET